MINKKYLLMIILSAGAVFNTYSQYLSNLNVTADEPLYSTYAAAIERSEYTVNESYQFMWFDPAKGINFEIKQAGTLGLAFKIDDTVRSKLSQFYKEPVVTASYSDLVKFTYYPYKNIRVDNFFIVYSSRIAILDVNITNEGAFDSELNLYPYMLNDLRNWTNISAIENSGLLFQHKELPDGWMKGHNIPFQEDLKNVLLINSSVDSWGTYNVFEKENDTLFTVWSNDLTNDELTNQKSLDEAKVLSLQKKLNITAGETVNLRIVRGVVEAEKDAGDLIEQCNELMNEDLNKYLLEDEERYSKIPALQFENKEHEALYWNAFSLIRQCMLPPEGESSYNYYVFSREPRWGWGYGGQVFHESLVMLAYAFMDPESAMNSQRVYIERQWDNGYINYRTGPYLNEQIVTNEQYTSSAPWYNWQNWEVYKITNDIDFLEEAYNSGKTFYNYYIENRDSDNDGLCEWGAHAVLESVRDARVAVWDKVADPVNFDAVDLNTMLVNEANSLYEMAMELGFEEEAEKWKKDANKRTELINKYMWDPETGFYYNIDKKDNDFTYEKENDLKRKEIIGFLPMWAGIASREQTEALMKHLTNPDEFWRNFGIPTLSADDSYYNPIGYWNGPIWVQWQYMMFRGLLNYGYRDEAKQLVDKVLDNIGYQLKTNHWFWEFYSADDYQAGWNKTYIWTGILSRFLIDLNNLK